MRGTIALRHVSAGTRDSNPVLRRGDTRHAARLNRRLKAAERGKRLPRGLFPCLFRHSAAVCRVDQGRERGRDPCWKPILPRSIRRACARTETGEHWCRTGLATIDPTCGTTGKPDPCRVGRARVGATRPASMHVAWCSCTRGMKRHMPREQTRSQWGRERPSGVRQQGTCRVWEGGRSRPRSAVALDPRRRPRARAAETAARRRRLQVSPASKDRNALLCGELVSSQLGHSC
jgi:hypothetical protein